MKLRSVQLGNGSIRFQESADPGAGADPSYETVADAAQGRRPAHFEVSFMIDANYESQGIETRNFIHWDVAIPAADPRISYHSVEDRAARLIIPMLRALADQLEADLSPFVSIANRQ